MRTLKKYIRRKQMAALYSKFNAHTMIHRNRFVETVVLAQDVLAKFGDEKLISAECGTWRGGMSFGLLSTLPNVRTHHMFDSFEGLPVPSELDATESAPMSSTDDIWHNNNTATIEDVQASVDAFGFSNRVQLHKGWFSDTLPKAEFDAPLSLLRMDGDWYESTLDILNNLYDKVRPGGLILIDDYYDWVGCSRAIHEFMAQRSAPERLHEISRGQVAYLIKED